MHFTYYILIVMAYKTSLKNYLKNSIYQNIRMFHRSCIILSNKNYLA